MAKALTKLNEALDLARKGYYVHPIKQGRKDVLLTPHGFKDATRDEAQIRKWWTQNPNANVSIATEASGLVVPDLDVKKADGIGNYAKFLAEAGLDPEPLVVATPSGGQHHYFRGQPCKGNNTGRIAAGVDLKSNGGYVLAPGSVLDGSGVGDVAGVYTTATGEPLPDVLDLPQVPEALRALFVSRIAGPAPTTGTGEVVTGGRETLAELLQFPVGEGCRNDWLPRVAGHYAKSGLSWEDYCYHVDQANLKCEPPLEGKELANIKANIWDNERGKADPESDAYQREVAQELRRLQIRKEAQRRFNEASLQGETEAGMFAAGGDFMFDIPDGTPAVWGTGLQVLWAEGEALMLVGPTGVGKTTLAGQVVRARLGLGSGEVLGLAVKPTKSRVLYLAMDRPQQIARSLRRHFDRSEREVINERLVVRQGPPPQDVARNPETLLELALQAGADTVVVDSVKDAAVNLSSDEAGSGYNRARQMLLAAGIEVLELHHQKKAHSDGSKPNDLNGVYGSAWITGGAGSVVLLWGEAGDLDLELVHLKQPAAIVGPWKIRNDHAAGTTTRIHGADPLALLASAGGDGLTATELAEAMGRDSKSDRDKQKSRRDLDRLTSEGLAEATKEQRGKQLATVWRATASGQGVLL